MSGNRSEPTEKCLQPHPVNGRWCAEDKDHQTDHAAQQGRGADAKDHTWPNTGGTSSN